MASLAPLPPLFRQRDFSALWWGQLISLMGERLTYLALVGLLAEHTHHFLEPRSSLLLTLLANVMLAPVLLFAPFTGPWVDRWNLKRVVVLSDLLRAAIVLLVPILYASTGHTFPVFVMVFLLFTCNVFFLPAKSAITPEIVAPSQLLAANAWLSGAGIAATAAGALGGGWLIDHMGWTTALYFNCATYLVSVAALLVIRYRPHARPLPGIGTAVGGYLHEVREGWRIVTTNPTVGLALTALGAVWIGGGFLHVAGNLHIQHAASAPGMERLGILMSVLGLGSGVSTWWLNTGGKRVPRPWLLGGGLLLAGLGLLAFAVSTRFAVFAAASFFVGMAAAPTFMLTETLLQEGTEQGQRGRVFSARDVLMRLVFLVGVSVAGWMTRAIGVTPALLMCAVLVAGAGVLSLAWGRRVPELMRTGAGSGKE
jgi:MFS family permease